MPECRRLRAGGFPRKGSPRRTCNARTLSLQDFQLVLVFRRAAADVREVRLLDLLDVELGGALSHCPEHVVERRRIALDPAQRIDTRDDEATQIGTHEALGLQLLHDFADALIEVHEHLRALFVRANRLADRLLREGFEAAYDGVVRAAGELAVLLVADAKRGERRFLKIEREAGLRA